MIKKIIKQTEYLLFDFSRPTVLSVTLAIGAKQLSDRKAIVTRITAIEELAAVTILCSDKTGTLTLNKLVIDRETITKYTDLEIDDIIRYAAYACNRENPDAMYVYIQFSNI